LTVVEAKAHGIPSIVFPSGGLVELVEHGRDGWVCDFPTAASLESALRHYVVHPANLAEQGKAALHSLSERLRVQDYGRRWAEIYMSCTPRS
jgi:glycosyltransferase involved in cell wall biosynthesis